MKLLFIHKIFRERSLAVSRTCPDWYQGPPPIARVPSKNWK